MWFLDKQTRTQSASMATNHASSSGNARVHRWCMHHHHPKTSAWALTQHQRRSSRHHSTALQCTHIEVTHRQPQAPQTTCQRGATSPAVPTASLPSQVFQHDSQSVPSLVFGYIHPIVIMRGRHCPVMHGPSGRSCGGPTSRPASPLFDGACVWMHRVAL